MSSCIDCSDWIEEVAPGFCMRLKEERKDAYTKAVRVIGGKETRYPVQIEQKKEKAFSELNRHERIALKSKKRAGK